MYTSACPSNSFSLDVLQHQNILVKSDQLNTIAVKSGTVYEQGFNEENDAKFKLFPHS